jgi:hypothetical protein
MAARYVMDRDEVQRLLTACTLLGCIDGLDARTDRILFVATGQAEAEAMVEAGGAVALFDRGDKGFVGTAELKPMDGASLDAFAQAGKPYGIPVEPVARFAAVSLAKAFPQADDAKWKKLMRLGGCRLDRIIRDETDIEALLAKFKPPSP